MSGHNSDFRPDFSEIPASKDPPKESTVLYDETVKYFIRNIKEAKLLGWHNTSISVPNEEIAVKISSLLRSIKEIHFKRDRCNFEINWE